MNHKSIFLLLLSLIQFIQLSLCEVKNEHDEERLVSSFSSSFIKPEYFEKRELKISNDTEIELTPEYFFKHKVIIISICSFLGFLVIGYFIAKCLNSKGKNSIIFTITLIFMDFVFDILFIFKHGKDVPWLFIPSLVVLIVPICVNCILSLTIIIKERNRNDSDKFKIWLKKNTNFAAIMTVFAGADIEALKLLSSQFAGLEIFDAGFSRNAHKWMLVGCVINAFLEDLPQFIIQILYKLNIDKNYSLIPFLTLVTSSIIILVHIVSRIYDVLNESDFSTAPDNQNQGQSSPTSPRDISNSHPYSHGYP